MSLKVPCDYTLMGDVWMPHHGMNKDGTLVNATGGAVSYISCTCGALFTITAHTKSDADHCRPQLEGMLQDHLDRS